MMEASCHRQVQRSKEASMATTLKFLPGSTIRWRATQFIVVDYADIDAIIARELGKRKLERIPIRDAKPDRTPGDQKAWTPETSSRAERIRLARRKLR
jgi:hypothetical protein